VRSAAADPSARYYQTIKLLGGAVVIGFLYGMVMTAATWWSVFGQNVVYPPAYSEQELAQRTSLSYGYLSLFKMAGVVLLAGVLACLGGMIALVAGLLRRRS
jgi:cytochrome b561